MGKRFPSLLPQFGSFILKRKYQDLLSQWDLSGRGNCGYTMEPFSQTIPPLEQNVTEKKTKNGEIHIKCPDSCIHQKGTNIVISAWKLKGASSLRSKMVQSQFGQTNGTGQRLAVVMVLLCASYHMNNATTKTRTTTEASILLL